MQKQQFGTIRSDRESLRNRGNGPLRRSVKTLIYKGVSVVSAVHVNVVNERRRAECTEDGERPTDPAPLGACEALAEKQGHTDAEHKSGRGDNFEFLHRQGCFFHGGSDRGGSAAASRWAFATSAMRAISSGSNAVD